MTNDIKNINTVIDNVVQKYGLYRLESCITGEPFDTWLVGTNPKFFIQKSLFKNGFEILPCDNNANLINRLAEGKNYFKRFENAAIELIKLENE